MHTTRPRQARKLFVNTARLDQARLKLARMPRVRIRRMQAHIGTHQRIKSPYLNSHVLWELVMLCYLLPDL